jgi:Uma2 family endonuclease
MTEQPSFGALREEPMRFTAEEFLEIAALPPLADVVGKLELVDGVIVHMSPAQNPHGYYQTQCLLRLSSAFGEETSDGWMPIVELTVRLNGHLVRDPDISVVRNPAGKVGVGKPEEVLLVVEIAHTTLRTDLTYKRLNYAGSGIPHYWVVDVEGRNVHVMGRPGEEDYQDEQVFPFGTDIPVPETDKTINLS